MIDFFDSFLASFARLMVARGILFPDLVERLKPHYIEAAKQMADGKITDSRLSVLTGLQRRDIARLRAFSPKEQRPNHLSRLVALWQTADGYGASKPLSKNGPDPSFEALARLVRRDVHPRTMLDTLEATGTVLVDPETHEVTLLQSSYQPLSGSEDQLAYLTANMGDHLAAAADNVLGQDPPHFERAVHYTQLAPAQIAELSAEHRAGQMALFEQLSARAAEMKKLPSPDATHRFRAGGYFYQQPEACE